VGGVGLAADLGYLIPPPSAFHRAVQRLAATRAAAWALARTLPALDRATERLSRDRTSAARLFTGLPALVVTTTGRRSGRPREAQLLGIPIGDDLALIGTNFGQPSTPAWVLNLEADPRAVASYAGRHVEVVARAANAAERDEILRRGREVYGGYAKYFGRISGRRVRVFVLGPVVRA
jgi:deazaflavin-dependent oxidoreductase (nitroreductase family)